MGMVFCRGCAKEIHETAPMCPHCGAPQFVANPAGAVPQPPRDSSLSRPSTYDEVPWYRKEWFAVLCVLFFTPGLLVILLTGDVYFVRKGEMRTVSRVTKVAFLMLSLLLMIFALAKGTSGSNAGASNVGQAGSREIKENSLINIDSADLYTYENSPIRTVLINKNLYAVLDKEAQDSGGYIVCGHIENADKFAAGDADTVSQELYREIAQDAVVKQATYIGLGCKMGSAEALAGTVKTTAASSSAPALHVQPAPANQPSVNAPSASTSSNTASDAIVGSYDCKCQGTMEIAKADANNYHIHVMLNAGRGCDEDEEGQAAVSAGNALKFAYQDEQKKSCEMTVQLTNGGAHVSDSCRPDDGKSDYCTTLGDYKKK